MNMTYLNLGIQQYTIQSLRELEIEQKCNEHAKMHMTAMLFEQQQDSPVYDTKVGTQIILQQKGEQSKILFQGVVIKISVEKKQGVYWLTIDSLSNTYLFDIVKVSRSFQDVNMLYTDVIHKIMENYNGSDMIDNATNGEAIEDLIVQYDQTDWQFFIRLASHFHTVIVPSAASEKAQFIIGMPKGEHIGDLNQYHYRIEKDIEQYLKWYENEAITELDSILFYIETTKDFMIGDSASFQDVTLYIKQKKATIKQGVMVYEYVLASENSFTQNKLYAQNIVGLSLKGRVLEVIEDTVKVQLEIDEQQDKQKAYAFPYTTMYTAEGNSGWYCMPEVDDTVLIYFPTQEEKDAVAMSSIRMMEKGSDKLSDPNIKYFRTKNGKELKFSPEEILITCCNGTNEQTGEQQIVYIRLNEKNGIEIVSTQPILLKSENNIELQSGEQIFIAAKEEIIFQCKTSQITVNKMIDIAGKEVRIN